MANIEESKQVKKIAKTKKKILDNQITFDFFGGFATTENNSVSPQKIKKEKVAREEARNYIWNEIFGNGIIQDIIENGSTRDLIDLIKALLPPEKQVQEIIGDLTTKKVFVTPKELKETDAHIDSVIEG